MYTHTPFTQPLTNKTHISAIYSNYPVELKTIVGTTKVPNSYWKITSILADNLSNLNSWMDEVSLILGMNSITRSIQNAILTGDPPAFFLDRDADGHVHCR